MSHVPPAENSICIIDPDPAVRDALRTRLVDLGPEIRCFDSAEAFLGWDGSDSTACLICEVHLSGMSGIELFEELKARGNIIPTILLAVDGEVAAAVRAIRAGAVDYFEKPFIDRALYRRVAAIVGGREKLRQPARAESALREPH